MTATVTAGRAHGRRALGWVEDDQWKLEPTMAHGAFGAMGGIQTSATDYAKVAFSLRAAAARRCDEGPVKRASVRRAPNFRRRGCGSTTCHCPSRQPRTPGNDRRDRL
jgi:hypothetical protein